MYCAACGTLLAPGLSYCNRCGMSLKERSEPKTDSVSHYLTAIGVIGVAGLSLMLGGAIALRKGAEFSGDIVGIFMLMTFSMIAIIEIFLCRQLSRLNRASEVSQSQPPLQPMTLPAEFRGPQPHALAEPLPSVTENTTRTLEYSRNEPSR
ncbi:MAG: hypothetical protein ACREA9_21290 [Pyrinomonadaceae bacterium]